VSVEIWWTESWTCADRNVHRKVVIRASSVRLRMTWRRFSLVCKRLRWVLTWISITLPTFRLLSKCFSRPCFFSTINFRNAARSSQTCRSHLGDHSVWQVDIKESEAQPWWVFDYEKDFISLFQFPFVACAASVLQSLCLFSDLNTLAFLYKRVISE
jgi:hypothetical protein